MDIRYNIRLWMMLLCSIAPVKLQYDGAAQDAAKGVASDLCPEEYSGCNWACPRLVDDCPGGRTSADPCLCCSVCLREAGEHCTLPKQPCDSDFGLVCNHGRCRGRMNVQIRSATLTSINLGWDDFLQDHYSNGQYVVYYTDEFSEGFVSEWKGQQQVGNNTFASIRDLEGNTDYYFRVTYRVPTQSGILIEGPLSEVALHRTGRPAPLGGCEDQGIHYDEGKTITQSCDSVCDCLLGTWICRPRGCPPEPDVVIIMNPINCRDVPHPDDPECCTIVQCDEGPTPFGEADCVRDGKRHLHGKTYNYGCEEVCYCDNGIETCTPYCQDPGVMIPDPETCPHPELNPPPEGECCPFWSCPPPPGSCEMNGNTYEEEEYFDIECSMRCQCLSGSISCVPRCPLDVHPPSLGCPSPTKVQVPGECCMQWECPQIPEEPECTYYGASVNITMKDGDWMDEGCESRCLCDKGSLVCMPMCARPSPPSPTPLCPNPVITKLNEDDCCEVIACHDPKQPSPNVVRDVSMFPFNSTSVSVGFTPPENDDLVKVMDGYNIFYTDHTDTENLDLKRWQVYRKDFPSGVQVKGHIIMDIHNLRRQTTYYLQIRVSIPDTMETRWPNTLPSTDTFVVTTVENKPQPCTYKSLVYQHKEKFFDGCESQCECLAGRTICRERCPQTDLLASDACPNPQKVVVEGECCPEWRCFPSEGDCSYKDTIYSDGMEWRSGCDMRCNCQKGQVTCQNICSSSPKLTAESKDCNYPVQVSVPDTCCKEWVCLDSQPSTQDNLPSLPLPLSAFHINISAVNVTAYNATITWPPLTDIQRKYIGEFRLKYRALSYDGPTWDTTVNFRPEVRQYTILDLRPARSYVVNLVVLVGNPKVAVTVNTNMLEIDTLWIPSKPYPGEPFHMEVFGTTDTSLSVRWEALPFEITDSIIGWRLVVLDSYDSSIIESELVEPSALSYTLHNLSDSSTYHVQLLGLWDNGTLTREVRSKTLEVTTLSRFESKGFISSIPSTALIIGLVIGVVVILIPLIIFIYLRVKKSHSKRYDVYMQSTTVNYDKNATYEQMYDSNSIVELSHNTLQETGLHIRRDSEAGLLDEHR